VLAEIWQYLWPELRRPIGNRLNLLDKASKNRGHEIIVSIDDRLLDKAKQAGRIIKLIEAMRNQLSDIGKKKKIDRPASLDERKHVIRQMLR